jgi:Na+/melibiose symporter-like transporter
MRVLFALIPLVSFIAGMFLIWRYPIDAEKAHATRAELERRRGPLYS